MKNLIFSLILILAASLSFAQEPPLELQDEGSILGKIRKLNCTGAGLVCSRSGITGTIDGSAGGGGGAPTNAQYWTGAADATLSAEKNLGALGTGLVINTAGVPSIYPGGTCTNQVVRVLGADGAVTCQTITLAYTSMNTLRLIGRTTAGVGVMEEIQVTSPLGLAGGQLTCTTCVTGTIYYQSVKDEGSSLSQESALNFVGGGVSCASLGGVHTTCTIPGVAGEAELDFGDSGVEFFGSFTVTDGNVSATSKLIISQSLAAATGRDQDENEMDRLICRGTGGSSQFTVYCDCPEGCHGKYKINYSYSS